MTLTPERILELPEESTPSPSMIERFTAVLDAFESPNARLSLEEVMTATGLARSTAHRILTSLVRLSWVERIPEGYRLGSRVLSFADWGVNAMELRHVAAPVLHELQIATGMVVHLAVLKGVHVHYLDKLGGRLAAQIPSRVGGRAPAHGTALGKAMLAWLPPEQVDVLAGAGLGRMTPRTISDLMLFHQELRRVRERRGLAFEQGECFPSVACVGSAIMGPDGPIGGISLSVSSPVPLEKVAPLLVDATRRIGAELASRPAEAPDDHGAAPPTWSAETLAGILATSTGRWM